MRSPTPAARSHPTVVDLVYIDAGGGHRASALALQAAIERAGLPWTVRLVNLREMLDPRGAFRRVTGMDPEDFYNQRLARGWTVGLAQELKLLQGLIRWGHTPLVRRLQRAWLRREPDLVVSLIPNFNRALCESLATSLPGVPYVTVLTDLADHPPNFWIEPGLAQHIVCGSDRALAQARAAGYDDRNAHAASGMLLRAEFHEAPSLPADERAALRVRLGLDPVQPTGLVLFGGQGSRAMLDIARHLPDTALILACGRNERLAQALRQPHGQRAPRVVLGFTPDVAHYMRLADFFIGKPGPGSISEAVQMRLPVIVSCNRSTLPQERYNAQWVQECGVGVVCRGFGAAALRPAVARLLADLPEHRAATARVNNRAAFELPQLLARILAESGQTGGGPAWRPSRTFRSVA
ncbi:glycosyltransferase [Variovorax dokdonensis]|uniref:Glycosyltransferase n=1 Tax=Variovorax dokdonensis TaxID=344883 RepID=A0ABT7NE94_9BURK|nr:glycosyltransferase [Variovorax dokdonensis]MDM0046254.1 glycosyltransferase [Variovorax dokdonensis]